MKKLLVLSTFIMALVNATGWAIDLDSAKGQGLVGESPNGYLEAVGSPSAEVKSLVKSVNSQRRALYKKSAKQNNVPLNNVETMAGQKAFSMTRSGNFIKKNGKWVKK